MQSWSLSQTRLEKNTPRYNRSRILLQQKLRAAALEHDVPGPLRLFMCTLPHFGLYTRKVPIRGGGRVYSVHTNRVNSGAKMTAFLPTSLMRMSSEGPTVFLSWSPMVSPMTLALWAGLPLPPKFPAELVAGRVQPVESVLAAPPGLVLLVDPGAGKTTFLKVLALNLALGQGEAVAPVLRREAGLVLGKLGWQPEDLDAFVPVPAGMFLNGDKKEEREIAEPYWIGKYPVTHAQYARFIADGGYRQ